MIVIFEEGAAGPPPVFCRLVCGPLPPPPPFVNVSVPNTVPSGASSQAVASVFGSLIIQRSDLDARTAPYVEPDTPLAFGGGADAMVVAGCVVV